MNHTLPDLRAIKDAAARIGPYIHRTPVLTCATLDALSGASLFFKCENLQKGGAFKVRGATNAVFSLTEAEAARGVATHSSGNHAAALALAAGWRGIRAHVVMPRNVPAVKRRAVEGYGAMIVDCEPTVASREATLAEVLAKTGAVYVPPFDDPRIIAGQGTAALEFLEQAPGLEIVIAPVGGGGLLSGTALTVKALSPSAQVFGAEPEMAGDAMVSLATGKIQPMNHPQTIADGLRTSLGPWTFAAIQARVDGILPVTEAGIVAAMRLMWERMKIVVEPSGAVPLAAVLAHQEKFAGRRVGLVISGGNVDLDQLPWG